MNIFRLTEAPDESNWLRTRKVSQGKKLGRASTTLYFTIYQHFTFIFRFLKIRGTYQMYSPRSFDV